MGDIYLRVQDGNESSIVAAKNVYIRANEAGYPIKKAKQIWIRPGNELVQAWEDDPTQFLVDHPTNNPNTDPNYWNWKPVWSMAVNYHFSDNNVQTVYVTQGAAIGSLLTGPTKTETISGASVTRSFYAWTRTAGLESSIVDENYVVNSSIDLYPLYDYVVTFKNGSEILERRVVKRHEMLGEVPVVEGVNDEHKVWMFRGNNNYIKYYDANTPITSDVVIIPATDLEVVFDLNGSGEISNSDKFYVSTIYGEDTWGDLIDNAPVPNAEGYGANYTTNEEYDFFHTGKIFLGWYTEKEGGTKITEKNRTTARTDKVFYAHWKDNISYDLYGLTPDGQQKYGKATLFDERYGDCNSINFTLSHYVDGNHSNYCIQSIPKTNFFADDFSYIPLFYVDESQASGEFGEPWYYKWEGILDEPQIQVEASATNLYQAANGRYYRYKVEKTRPAYWLTINLKEGVSSSSNITNLNKNDFVWDANTNFDKMFDFAAGQVKILSSYNSTNGIGKYIPYFNDNGNLIDRDTKWETSYDNVSSYGLKLYFSSLKRSLGGLCWWKWSARSSNLNGYSLISGDTSTTRLDATWRTMWVTTSLSLPNGDNETWSWQVQNHAHKTGESKTQCAVLHGICPHHYKVEGIQRSNGETVTIASNIPNTTLDANSTTGAASYAINNLINYSDLILTAYDENNKFYNSFTKDIYNYRIDYSYFPNHDSTSRITATDASYLISNYIPIKSPANSYYYNDTYSTRIFDHWTYNSINYSPGDYFQGSTSITEDKVVTMSAYYINKFNITSSLLGFAANSHTNTLTWNEIYANDDTTEKAAWYKVIGTNSNNQEVILSDISGYTNGFIPASAAANGQLSLTNSAFDNTITSVRVVVYNSDKTLYNSYSNTITWYELRFYAGSYGQNLNKSKIYRLSGETIGTLPTVESKRDNYSFNGWAAERYSSTQGLIRTAITENTILSSLSVYSSEYPHRQAYPRWTQTGYTITFDNSYPWYGTTYNLYANKSSDNTYTSAAAKTVAIGSSTNLPTPSAAFTQSRTANGITSTLSWAFVGWSTARSNFMGSTASNGEYTPTTTGGATITIMNAGSSYTPESNITLYGVWKLNQFLITFNPNYSGAATTSKYTNYNNQVQLTDLTRSDYNFLGWYSASSGGAQYGTVGTTSYAAFTSNTTLYAHWEEIVTTVTVTYQYRDSNGSWTTDTEEVTPGESFNLWGGNEGFDSSDWQYDDSDGQSKKFVSWTKNGTAVSGTQTISENTTYVATYMNYFDVSAFNFEWDFLLYANINCHFGFVRPNNLTQYDISDYLIQTYNGSSWSTLVSDSSYSSAIQNYFGTMNSNATTIRFTIKDGDIQNYIDESISWAQVIIQKASGVQVASLSAPLNKTDLSQILEYYFDELIEPIRLTNNETAPYYMSTFSSYTNVTKNTTINFNTTYLLTSSIISNNSVTLRVINETGDLWLDAPELVYSSYDDYTVGYEKYFDAESVYVEKCGNQGSTEMPTSLILNSNWYRKQAQEEYLPAIEYDCYVGVFSNNNYFFATRAKNTKTYNNISYEVYSEWEEVDGNSNQKVYGVSWDGSSSTVWIRTDDATNFSDPISYVAGMTAAQCSSPFDNIMPWAGMQIVERGDNVMVSIPKFYYKLEQNGNGLNIQISNSNLSGYHVSPAHMDRGDGNGERNVVYIGRYHTSKNYFSESGQLPIYSYTGQSTPNSARTAASNDNLYYMDFAMRFTIWLLYLVEYADWNSQTKIGYGCGDGANRGNMGYTDSMPYHTGTTQNSKTTYGLGTQYRNIEGLWDNVPDYCACCQNDSKKNFKVKLSPSDTLKTIATNPTTIPMFPKKMVVKNITGTFPLFMPSTKGGSNSTYIPDMWASATTTGVYFCGGKFNKTLDYGLFYMTTTSNPTNVSYRLMELP